MPITPATCPLDCPDACGMLVETDERGRFVELKGNPAHGWSRGTLCSKTASYGDLIVSPERLLQPLVRVSGKQSPLRAASWEQAFERIAERVRPLAPGRTLAAWYAGSMGLVQRNAPLAVMNAIGAAQVDGGLCDNSASAGYENVLGRVVGADIESAHESDFLLAWGCDVVRTHQHLQPAMQQLCKASRPVVAIDIYRSDTLRAVERWGGRGLVLHPGTDAALALALARLCFERGWADRAFLARECKGAAEFEQHVRAGHSLEWAEKITGIAARDIERLGADLFAAKQPLIKTGVGFARRRVGAGSMRAVCSLAAVLGRVDRLHYESFDCFRLDLSAVARPDLHPLGAPQVIRHVELGRELNSGRFQAVFVWGHNPAVTCPDSRAVRAGLAREDVFTVVHEHFLTESAQLADVVLPATMFPEHTDVYRSYGHRRMHFTRGAVVAPGNGAGPRSNVRTFDGIARALGVHEKVGSLDEASLCARLLEDNRERIGPAALATLLRGEPAKIEPPKIDGWGTPSGKIELVSEAAGAKGQPAMATYVADDACGEGDLPFWLICAPSRATHNSTYSHSARHLARQGPPVVHLAREDARRLGCADGCQVRLSNARGSLTMPARLSDDLKPGFARVDGLPRAVDLPEKTGINSLVAGAVSDLGEGNILYSTKIRIEPLAAGSF